MEYDLTKIPALPLLSEIEIDPNGYAVLDQNGVTYKVKISAFLNAANKFTDLEDTPDSYADQAGKVPAVKTDQTGLEFIDIQEYEIVTGTTASDNDKIPTKAYVDDNILSGGVNYIDYIPQVSAPTYTEGRVYYDDTKKALTYFNDSSEVAVNLGQEILFIVENQTGGLLSNGTVISPDETTVITKADAYIKDKSRIIAVLTEDIADGETGYATKLGQVGGLDTSTFSAGQVVYLGTDGEFIADTPTDGGYICIVGVVDVVHATEGIITVDTKTSDITVEVTDTNGFPPDQRTGTTLSFVDGTRTFTISPTGASFHFYELGDKYTKLSPDSIVITDVTGGHLIYYNNGILTAIANPSTAQAEDVILNHAIVAYIYWNAVTSASVLLWDERHGISMSPMTHLYLHETRGSQYVYGLALNGFVIGNGSLNSHAQFGNLLGQTRDEDIAFDITTTASTVGFTYLYRSGATGIWTKGTNAGYSFPLGATPLPQFNQFTGATYQLTEVTSGNYMLLHIFGSNNNDLKPFVIVGDSQYTTISAATAGANDEISRILVNLPLPEFVPLGTVIIEGKTSFTNSVNTRVVQTSLSENYIDWRTTELATGAAPTNHNNLAGLELAGVGVNWGHIDETLYDTIINGGGHVIQQDGVDSLPQETNLNFRTNGAKTVVSNETGVATHIDIQLEANVDVDPTGVSAGDVWGKDATNTKTVPISTQVFDGVYNGTPEANISANGQLSMIIPAGFAIYSITISETSGNAAGNISIGSTALGTDIVNALTVGANADLLATLVTNYFSRVNDTDMYISSSAWGSGVVTIYVTFIKI